jgi:hypothetical protein
MRNEQPFAEKITDMPIDPVMMTALFAISSERVNKKSFQTFVVLLISQRFCDGFHRILTLTASEFSHIHYKVSEI